MATHIFTVNEKTFKVHLNYMFAGTGKDGAEHQTGALADISGIRIGDFVCFYVMNKGFYGFFKIKSNPFYEKFKNQYLNDLLGKNLTYRVLIEPYKVFEDFKSEWDVMENPVYIKDRSIYNMQWSWIFKKLNANRGCLSIDETESSLLFEIIGDGNKILKKTNSYDYLNAKIIESEINLKYDGNTEVVLRESRKINIEEDLKILFTSESNKNQILNEVLKPDIYGKVNFISNEVLCSFSERRLDLVLGTENKFCFLIELKNEFKFDHRIYNQLKEYSRWVSSYRINYEKIVPILIIKEARNISTRKNSKYYKYLSKNNYEKNITSDWYSDILKKLDEAKNKLILENINNLEELQVFCFLTNENNDLKEFKKII